MKEWDGIKVGLSKLKLIITGLFLALPCLSFAAWNMDFQPGNTLFSP